MSSRKPLPGKEFIQYQRWELNNLDSHAAAARLPTADEVEHIVEQIQRQAHQEGYEAGLREGTAAGYRQGEALAQSEAARLQSEAARLQALMVVAQEALQQLEQAVGQELLMLALDLTRQMLRQALKVKPELLLPVVRGAMDSIPQHLQHPHLHLHPEDAALVRAQMQAELIAAGWKIIDDHRIERGGCRIETSTAEVDATLPARWQILAAALGQDVSWLDE
jgi:flagellar assembly protein FliH